MRTATLRPNCSTSVMCLCERTLKKQTTHKQKDWLLKNMLWLILRFVHRPIMILRVHIFSAFSFCIHPFSLKSFVIRIKWIFHNNGSSWFCKKFKLMTFSRPVPFISPNRKAAPAATFYKFPLRNFAVAKKNRKREAFGENQDWFWCRKVRLSVEIQRSN